MLHNLKVQGIIRNYEIIIVVGVFLLIVGGIFVYLRMIKRREIKDISVSRRKEAILEKMIKRLRR